jgi:hypothetical protein
MFGSTIVDVAIGLMFFYFLFSVITTHVNEFIATKMQWRAKDLEDQIRRMLGDPNLANRVLQNPVITTIASRDGKPSYIPPNTFALALFDAFVPEGQSANVFDHVRAGVVSNLPTNKASEAVLKIIDHANGDMKQARAGAEEWFNAAMDRLSGAYKRRMQYVTLLVSLLLTALLGADTLSIADALYKEPTLRAAVTGAAQAAPASQQAQAPQGTPPTVSSLQQSVALLSKSGLPIGWGTLPTDLGGWFRKVLGLLITTLAISLGAPFWFDILKNVANLRSSGPAPAAAPSPAPAASAPAATVSIVPVKPTTEVAPATPPQATYPGGI